MLFGPLGRMQQVPIPADGSTFSVTVTPTSSGLASGGRAVHRLATPYRVYALKYGGSTPDLFKLVDLYAGAYGPGPHYLTPPDYQSGNMLPPRWATGSMLRAVAGSWCSAPSVDSTLGLDGSASVFSNPSGLHPSDGPHQTVIPPAGKPVEVRVFGSASGGAVVRASRMTPAGVWSTVADIAPSSTPAAVELVSAADASAGTYQAVRLQIIVPSGGSLTVAHINVTTATTDTLPLPGRGAGPFQFNNSAGADQVTPRWETIGIAFDLEEVEE